MKRTIRTFLRKFGFDIIKFRKNEMGIYPFYDMAKFVKSDNPMLFDIGANVGQTIKDFKEVFKKSTIHAFEPSSDTFEILKKNTSNYKNIHLWNFGLGATNGDLILNEFNLSNTNSFLEINNTNPKNLKKQTQVKVTTVDKFSEEQKIQAIDVLKIDTEGFELEVFKGAEKLFNAGKIGLLFFEVSFVDSHNNMPSLSELWNFAIKKNFELVSIYPAVHRKNMAVYTNILFKHNNY